MAELDPRLAIPPELEAWLVLAIGGYLLVVPVVAFERFHMSILLGFAVFLVAVAGINSHVLVMLPLAIGYPVFAAVMALHLVTWGYRALKRRRTLTRARERLRAHRRGLEIARQAEGPFRGLSD